MLLFNPEGIIVILISLTVHEFSHAWVAYILGDSTAKYQGRLSLNPLVHLDPLGTLMMLIVGFGWAKPVPINPANFKHPRRDDIFVSLAGPVSNLILAFLFAIPLKYISPNSPMVEFYYIAVYANTALAVFNILPIYPLDGSHILASLTPWKYRHHTSQFLKNGPFILLSIVMFERLTHTYLLSPIIYNVVQKILFIIGIST